MITEAELSGTEGELSPSACLDVLQPLLDNPEFVTKMRALVPESPTSQDIDQESGNNSTEVFIENQLEPEYFFTNFF